LDGNVPLPSVLYFKQLAVFRLAWEDPIEELNNSETMRARNLFADAKFAKVILLESSDAGLLPPNGDLNDVCHECIHSMRDREAV
jgi:hypothetical protein